MGPCPRLLVCLRTFLPCCPNHVSQIAMLRMSEKEWETLRQQYNELKQKHRDLQGQAVELQMSLKEFKQDHESEVTDLAEDLKVANDDSIKFEMEVERLEQDVARAVEVCLMKNGH